MSSALCRVLQGPWALMAWSLFRVVTSEGCPPSVENLKELKMYSPGTWFFFFLLSEGSYKEKNTANLSNFIFLEKKRGFCKQSLVHCESDMIYPKQILSKFPSK